MKHKNRIKSIALLSVGLLTLTSCGSKIPEEWKEGVSWVGQDSETAYNALQNEARRNTYKTIESYFPNDWNSARTFQAENGKFLTNIVDGLLAVDEYNRIVPELATEVPEIGKGISTVKATVTTDESGQLADVFKVDLTIRDNANWVKNSGWGRETVEKVKAEDFVTALKMNLDFNNLSQSSYLVTMFIDGAEEYNEYTKYVYLSRNNYRIVNDDAPAEICSPGAIISPNDEDCSKYSTAIPKENDAGFNALVAKELKVDQSVIPSIKNFSRVGVKADGQNLSFTLTGQQDYFLSVLTYTPFLPVPTDYYNNDPASYGLTARNILSCGAYVVDDSYQDGVSSELILNKSLNYYQKETVKNARVIVKKAPEDTRADTARLFFESGTIDGFTVNKEDTTGWEKYVTGEDGKGTITKPSSDVAYSQQSNGNGSTYAFFLNTNRTVWKGSMMDPNSTDKWDECNVPGNNINEMVTETLSGEKTEAYPSAILNTNIALAYSPKLREAILTALDYPTYYRYRTNAEDSYQDRKISVNTYTPKEFYMTGEDHAANGGNDYVDYLSTSYVNKKIIGQNGEAKAAEYGATTVEQLLAGSAEAKAYGQTLLAAADQVFESEYLGGLALIPEVQGGVFKGWKKAAEGTTYNTATGVGNTNGGFGTGAVLGAGSVEGENEVWYESRSRDTEYLSNLITEGIAEAEANYKAFTGKDYKVKTPIVVEFPTLQFSEDMTKNQATLLNQTNANLNGGKYIKKDPQDKQGRAIGIGNDVLNDNSKSINASDARVLLIQSTKGNISTNESYQSVAGSYNFSMVNSGWGPDYADPSTYANTVKIDGDMADNAGLRSNSTPKEYERLDQYVTQGYDAMLEKIETIHDKGDRAQAFADAEIHLLFENFILRPVEMMGQGINVTVRRSVNKGVTSMTWGLSSYKYKGIEVLDRTLKGSEASSIYEQLTYLRNNPNNIK